MDFWCFALFWWQIGNNPVSRTSSDRVLGRKFLLDTVPKIEMIDR
jgi:hypothetical protein